MTPGSTWSYLDEEVPWGMLLPGQDSPRGAETLLLNTLECMPEEGALLTGASFPPATFLGLPTNLFLGCDGVARFEFG